MSLCAIAVDGKSDIRRHFSCPHPKTRVESKHEKARARRAGEGVAIMLAIFGEVVWAVKVVFSAWLDHWILFLAMIMLTVFVDQFVIPLAFTLK
ncbi:hypothetical protein NN6n1_12900 [Shinella zoogloeoides]